MTPAIGKILILTGLVIAVIGLVVYFAGDKLHWLGKLPGDIRVERENFRFYFPLTTMLLVSLLLNLMIVLVKRFWN